MLKYRQKSLNSCFFGKLALEFATMEQTKPANDLSLRIEDSLKSKIGNNIDFTNYVLKNEKQSKKI